MLRLRIILFITVFFSAATALAAPVEVVVHGLGGDALQNARKALALPYGLVQDGRVNRFWLERFNSQIADKVSESVQPFGYYNARITTELEKIAENNYRITVTVDSGRPVRITRASVALEGPGSSEQRLVQLVRAFPLGKGDVLLQRKYEEAKGSLKSAAVELGYLDADFSRHTIEIDPAASSASIDLRMETGVRYRFGDVRFEGAPRYPEQFLNRYVTFEPGEVFSFAKLGETQLNLINTDRFKEVLPVPEKERASDSRVPILIRLDEAPTRRLRPGIGYATDVGLRFSLEYRDMNVFDRGHEFRAQLHLSKRLQSLGAGYTIPDTEDINTSTGLQVNVKKEDVSTYTNKAASAEVNRTTGFRRGKLATIYARFEREDSTVGSEQIQSRLVLPGVRYSEQRYDNLIRPRRGHHYTLDVRGTHQALGSNTRFFQVVTEGNVLVPLPRRLSLFARIKAGATFQNDPLSKLPVSYRFFAGGDVSVRGYAYQSLGPTDDTGAVTGGRDTLVGSIELERALFRNWAVAAFYDAGNAFNSFSEMHLFQGAGVGVRYYTLVGALRLDLARQISVEDPSYRVHFTLGFAF